MKEQFKKPFPAKDNWPEGRNNGSYQYTTEYVHVFNKNSADRSPTTSSKEYAPPANKNKFLKMPFKG